MHKLYLVNKRISYRNSFFTPRKKMNQYTHKNKNTLRYTGNLKYHTGYPKNFYTYDKSTNDSFIVSGF